MAQTLTPEPFYVDLHGHGHPKQRLELGYLLSGTKLRNSNSTLNTVQYIGNSSIQNMVSSNINNYTHAELLRGNYTLGTLMANAGYPAVPSMQDFYPDTSDAFFSGGYNTQNHTCNTPGVASNGVQIEMNYTGVSDNSVNINAFADSLSRMLVFYLNHHFNVNLGSCNISGVNGMISNRITIYPTLLSARELLFFNYNFANADYQIHYMTGTLVQKGKCRDNIVLNIKLLSGIYLLQICIQERKINFKLLV